MTSRIERNRLSNAFGQANNGRDDAFNHVPCRTHQLNRHRGSFHQRTRRKRHREAAPDPERRQGQRPTANAVERELDECDVNSDHDDAVSGRPNTLDHEEAPWVVNQKKKDATTAAATKEKDAKIAALTQVSFSKILVDLSSISLLIHSLPLPPSSHLSHLLLPSPSLSRTPVVSPPSSSLLGSLQCSPWRPYRALL